MNIDKKEIILLIKKSKQLSEYELCQLIFKYYGFDLNKTVQFLVSLDGGFDFLEIRQHIIKINWSANRRK